MLKTHTGKSKQQVSPGEQLARSLVQLDDELIALATSSLPQHVVRKAFRQVAIKTAGAIGCCHVTRDGSSDWTIESRNSTGRTPATGRVEDELAVRCDDALKSGDVVAAQLPSADGIVGLLAPVAGAEPELLLLIMANPVQAPAALPIARRVVSVLRMWLQRKVAQDVDWQCNSLAAILELVARVEGCGGVKDACHFIVNELHRHLDCGTIAIGTLHNQRIKLQAVSGVGKIDHSSATSNCFIQAIQESIARPEPGLWPSIEDDSEFLLLAHKQLAATHQCEAVYSHPLVDPDGKVVGGWLLTGKREQLQSDEVSRFVQAASPCVASSLQLLHRLRGTRVKRAFDWARRKTNAITRGLICFLALALTLAMFVPVAYRIRCRCTTEPVFRRYAVAPFDGLIVEGFVKPGDQVSQGQTLAEIDGRTVHWELSGVTAESEQSRLQRSIELADGNIPKTFLAELESERLAARRSVLEFRKDNLLVKSPIDGVVLSGSLERAEAASIKTGQVLFEVGPISPIRIEIAVPADEIAHVKQGHKATVWVEGFEDQEIVGELVRIHPRSEIRDAENVFVAEFEIDNSDNRLRPGMNGHVRLDCEKRSLGWSLFHKPYNYMRSRFTWW